MSNDRGVLPADAVALPIASAIDWLRLLWVSLPAPSRATTAGVRACALPAASSALPSHEFIPNEAVEGAANSFPSSIEIIVEEITADNLSKV